MNIPHRIVTYSLRDAQGTSDGYYRTISGLADSTLIALKPALDPVIARYQEYAATGGNDATEWIEHALVALTLGVLWRVYAPPGAPPTLDGFDLVMARLEQAGCFEQEIARFRAWGALGAAQLPSIVSQTLARVLACAAEFEENAEQALGGYTANVERFLSAEWAPHPERDDTGLRGRKRVEYHLCMLGTEWLNRAFRARFLATPGKVVVVPPCMCARPEGECRAAPDGQGAAVCRRCTRDCRVNELTQRCRASGVQVCIVPEDLGSLARVENGRDAVGIVGISCPLTNMPGGWRAHSLGLPAQGLLLDYCGCSYHWDDQGFPTDTNFKQLGQLLNLAAIGKDNSGMA